MERLVAVQCGDGVHKGTNPNAVMNRSQALDGLCDGLVGLN